MKIFVISLAVLSFFAHDSECFRKCFPLTTPEPTTPGPSTTTTEPPTTATTTEPTTTTTETTTKVPCVANFITYDPLTNPTLPATDGVLGGTYINNNPIYVGLAHAPASINYCFNEQVLPGYIDVSTTKPGAYAECVNEVYDGTNPIYLQNNPNFKWVAATNATTSTIPNLVLYNTTTNFIFAFGRTTLTSSTGITYTTVSKVHLNVYPTGLFYLKEDGKGTLITTGYEVLVCS